jgi:hypothetical protein
LLTAQPLRLAGSGVTHWAETKLVKAGVKSLTTMTFTALAELFE